MKIFQFSILILIAILITGCNASDPTVESTPSSTATPTLPQPEVNTTQAPDAAAAAQAYLVAWKAEDYAAMYGMLTPVSQDAISEEDFITRYREFAAEAALSDIDYNILSSLTQTRTSQASYQVLLHSVLVGDIERETTMNLSLEDGEWRVQWDDALIIPELSGGNTLSMEYKIPSRGNIYDVNGHALVAQSDATALGLIPDQIDPEQESGLLSILGRILGIRAETISNMYEDFPPGADWYLPLQAASADEIQQYEETLTGWPGLVMRPFRARYYFDGGIAPHVVGYVSAIQEEEVEEYKRQGYRIDERVGRIGLEAWGETYLSGTRGGSLYVIDPDGAIVTKLGETSPAPAQAIYTTLDSDLQLKAQEAINGFLGAVVVLERDTGRVLAMASSPGYDPNLFEPTNFNRSYLINELFDINAVPLLNRAAQGQYPLGSVFKLITIAAALESGVYTADSIYECGHTFTELNGVTLYDWTYDKELPASGTLTLPEGLMRSCNPYFYHIGLDLFNQGLTTAISDMARGFGLGAPTGIEQITEEDGQVPDPESQLDATNGAIGQGALQVTPLQVAAFTAALGNGGTLFTPQIVESITPPDGDPTFTFSPQASGTLPISPQTLQIIQDAMVSVVENRRGTAHYIFPNFEIPVAGKTGTAQDPPRDPHSWFAGYTFAEREDKPDIAVVVILENTGEGSEWAAPVFKGIVQSYFFGQRSTFPWEAMPGVWREPTPEVTETPTPTPGDE